MNIVICPTVREAYVEWNPKKYLKCVINGHCDLSLTDASPQWVETNGPEVVSPGASVTLRCKVQGSPAPIVTWTIREKIVKQRDPRMEIIRKVSHRQFYFLRKGFINVTKKYFKFYIVSGL